MSKSDQAGQVAPLGEGDATRKTTRPKWRAPEVAELRDAIPGLRVIELAGVGGMSAVYRAEQRRLGRTVAVKVLPIATGPDEEARERFEREARVLSGLNHPHILQIHDFGSLPDGTLYLVTEWAGGGDFSKMLDGKPHPPSKVVAWVKQIGAALDAAHDRGVIHRDLKPANVLVLDDGRLTLADFGLAHAPGRGSERGLTTTGAIFGTFDYMAPEQMEAAGRISPAVDIYALGVMTYQMLTGRVPRGAYARPSRIVSVPSEVDTFLDSAMAHDPLHRPRSGSEFARMLDRACRAWERRRYRRLVVLGATLVAVALAWARAEIIRSEREEAAHEARSTLLVAESRLLEARKERAEALRLVEEARAMQAEANEMAAAAAAALVRQFGGPGADHGAPENPGINAVLTGTDVRATPASSSDATHFSTEAGARDGNRAELLASPWSWVLPEVKPAEHALAGDWKLVGGELISGAGRCIVSLPVRSAANYDIAIEFTRESGDGIVAVFLPTSAGEGVFEIDGASAGLVELSGEGGAPRGEFSLTAPIENGRKYRLVIEVRHARVSVLWDRSASTTWDLSGHRLEIPARWRARSKIGLALGSSRSPTTFHRVAYRTWPAEPMP